MMITNITETSLTGTAVPPEGGNCSSGCKFTVTSGRHTYAATIFYDISNNIILFNF